MQNVGPTLIAMTTKFGLGAEIQSPTGLCVYTSVCSMYYVCVWSACTDTTITLSPVSEADAGIYQCIANNVVGSAYATAVLTVRPPTSTVESQTVDDISINIMSPPPSHTGTYVIGKVCGRQKALYHIGHGGG